MKSIASKRASRRAHAKHPVWCSCGKKLFGNGGKSSHFAAHDRRGETYAWSCDGPIAVPENGE